MTEKQFNDAFTTAGGWFIAMYLEQILDGDKSSTELAEIIFRDGMDRDIENTKARVSQVRRIISHRQVNKALIKIRDSRRIKPEAIKKARELLAKSESGELKI